MSTAETITEPLPKVDAPQPVAEGASPTEAILLPGVTPRDPKGTYTISLLDLDLTMYPNYRKTVTEGHIKYLQASLGMNKNGEQINTLNGAWLANGKVALIGGFCREEAMERNALRAVINAYNEHHKLTSGDKGYVPPGGLGFACRQERERIRETSAEWKQRYEDALKKYPVNVTTAPVESRLEAMERGIADNKLREEASLFDEVARIVDMLELGMSGKRVAECTGDSQAAVSQQKKIWELFQVFPELIKENTKSGTPADKDEAAIATLCFEEFMTRVHLDKKHERKITFSHARDYSGVVLHATAPLAWKQTYTLLKELVGYSEREKKVIHKPTMDYTIWKTKIGDAVALGKMPPPGTAPTVVTDPTQPTPGLAAPAPGQVAGTAAANATNVTNAPVPTAVHDAGSLAAKQAAGTTATTTPGKAEIVLPGDALAEARIREANESRAVSGSVAPATTMASVTPTPLQSLDVADRDAPDQDDLNQDDMDTNEPSHADDLALMAELAGSGVPMAPPVPTGEKKTNMKSAPGSRVQMSTPENLEMKAIGAAAMAIDPETNAVDRACQMFSAVTLYSALGLNQPEGECNKSYVNYVEGLISYIEALEAVANTKATDFEKEQLKTLKPVMDKPAIQILDE